MATLPHLDINTEAKAEIVMKAEGQELRKRKIMVYNVAPGANQQGQDMTQQRSSICQSSKDTCSDVSSLVIHIVTGRGSWLWPFKTCNGKIYITLFDGQGIALSEKIAITRPVSPSFNPGEIYSCMVPKSLLKNPKSPPPKVSRIQVFNDYTESCLWQWHLDKVVVENTESYGVSVFPYKGWIKGQTDYRLVADDHATKLPEQGEDRKELENQRKIYQYLKLDGKASIPAQVDKLPKAERFPFSQMVRFFLRFLRNLIASSRKKACKKSWESLDDLLTVYGMYTGTLSLPPVNKKKTWMDDVHFGYQRVNGLNHSLIELCRELPTSLPVTDDMMRSHLNGLTLKEALKQRRLFVVDLGILQNIPVQDGLKLCAPIGLFFSNNDDELLPVAIRLERDAYAPVFLPKSHSIEWQLVKLWFNNADAIYHQSVAHLGLTHLLMEGIAVATNRQLSSGHPVYKLLKPHFLYIMAINDLARKRLISKGGFLDKTLNTGAKGTLALIAKELEHWRLDVDGTLPASLKKRGLDDLEVLPSYHYREDALALYHAIWKYVTEYVKLYYNNDQPGILQGDREIQAWAAELARDRNSQEGGCGIQGVPGFRSDVPGDNGKLQTVDQLVTILTSVIFTCSVEHASVNFPQYEEFGYPINYTSLLKGSPPRNDREYEKRDILEALPTPDETLEIMVVTDVLSQKHTNSLGQFETVYFTENKPLACLTAFQGSLQEIQREIAEKNDSRRRSHYKHLDPLRIPNSISI